MFACSLGSPALNPSEGWIGGEFEIHTADSPVGNERPCAWYGDALGQVLYFGESAFWSAYRAAGQIPTADLAAATPRRIGRFDLELERHLAPLDVAPGAVPSGVWDVLAHPNGWIYFTTFFDSAGRVNPRTGEILHFDGAGQGLAELAPGPGGTLLASRYSDGSVVQLDEAGQVLRELSLDSPAGFQIAPKSLAFDPMRREIWVTTDLLPASDTRQGGRGHPALVIDLEGRERLRIEAPEVQAVGFESGGAGWLAQVRGSHLELVDLSSSTSARDPSAAKSRVLDPSFPAKLDFVQHLSVTESGRAVVMRWSGRVHVLEPSGQLRSFDLPRFETQGLYYSAVISGDRICATYCAGLSVVCGPAP